MMKMVYTLLKITCSDKQREPWEEPLFRPYLPEGVKKAGKSFGVYLLWVVIAIVATLFMFSLFQATTKAW